MNTLFSDLKASTESNNEERIKSTLQSIILSGPILHITQAELFIVKPLFKHPSRVVLETTAEVLAEIAKSSENRDLLTSEDVILFLLGLLDYEECALSVQACRSLGNICYDNTKAREIIGKSGLTKLMLSIKRNKILKNVKLNTVYFGCLLNLLMDNVDLQKEAFDNNVLELIESALKDQEEDIVDDYSLHLLCIVNIIVEYKPEHCLKESLCSLLIKYLRNSSNTQIVYYCLEILHGQAENEDTKIFLAKQGLCEFVISLIEKYENMVDDEETSFALRMACDIIVVILTEDEPMILLYNNGEGSVYKSMLQWMNSKDIDLSSTGILAIGNFARNDTHCIQMVQSGISKKLLELLPNNNISMDNEEIKLQHAILSTLRNLVILPDNRIQMINEGLIEILYPILSSNYSPVIFKLLGTLRIITDGQENTTLDLVMRKDLLEKIVQFYFHSDHVGVRGEACRLLAWLIKNCHSFKAYAQILDIKDCIKCLVQMILSSHSLMQNESFYAINLICLYCLKDTHKAIINNESNSKKKLSESLVEADIAESLTFIINKYKDKFELETLNNLLTLLKNLVQLDNVLEHLKISNIKNALVKLSEANCYDFGERILTLVQIVNNS